MSQFNAPPRRASSGGLNVYTGLLCAACLVLLVGVALLVMANMEHSSVDGEGGGPFTMIEVR